MCLHHFVSGQAPANLRLTAFEPPTPTYFSRRSEVVPMAFPNVMTLKETNHAVCGRKRACITLAAVSNRQRDLYMSFFLVLKTSCTIRFSVMQRWYVEEEWLISDHNRMCKLWTLLPRHQKEDVNSRDSISYFVRISVQRLMIPSHSMVRTERENRAAMQ
jgi:hypothetical protein